MPIQAQYESIFPKPDFNDRPECGVFDYCFPDLWFNCRESRIIDFSWRKTGMYKPVWIGDHLSGSLKSVEDGNKGDFFIMPSPGFLLASYFGSLNSENRGSFPLSEVMTINPEIRPPNCTKQTHFKPINDRI